MTVNPVFDALTVNGQISGGGNAVAITATNSVSARTAANRFADVFNVKDYGAVGDGATDDSAAFNACFAAAKAWQATQIPDPYGLAYGNTFRAPPVVINIPYSVYAIYNTLNWTNLYYCTILGHGATLRGLTTGKPVIDAYGARYMVLRELTIYGDLSSSPTIGIQIGRNTANIDTDNNLWDNVCIRGAFTLTCMYNMGSETSTFFRCQFWDSASGAYGIIEDGYNHWGITSQFITCDIPAGQLQSFEENLFINCDVRSTSPTGIGAWIGGGSRHKWDVCYIAAFKYGFVMYGQSGQQANFFTSNTHVELATDAYYFTGDTLFNMFNAQLRDDNCFVSNSFIKLDPSITTIAFANPHFEIGGFQNYMTAKWFDTPSKIQLWGADVYGPTTPAWVAPAIFQGRLNLLFGEKYYGIVADGITTPQIVAAASGNVQLDLKSAGSSPLVLWTGTSPGVVVNPVASAVNVVGLTGSAMGAGVTVAAQGSDANIVLQLVSKGNAPVNILTAGGAGLSVPNVAGAVNSIALAGSVTGSGVAIYPTGSDANTAMIVGSKGNAPVLLGTGGGIQVRVQNVAGAVNFVQLSGSATGSGVQISPQGSDTNTDLIAAGKGTGNFVSSTPFKALVGAGFFGHAAPGSQPAAPVTLADVIAIIRGCGLSA